MKNEKITYQEYCELTGISDAEFLEKVALGYPRLKDYRILVRRALSWEYRQIAKVRREANDIRH